MSEVVFKEISFRNFLSFSNLKTTVALNKKGTTLLSGENLDEGGSSGAGKTSVISALAYVLYDKVPSGISKDKLINRTNDAKKVLMEVELKLSVGAEEYTIRRCRGASNEVRLWHGDKDITPDSVSNFNAAVEDLIGFSYGMFSQIILFNNNSTPFLDLRLAEQRDLIEELMKITMLSRKAEALKKDISETDAQVKLTTALYEQTKAKYTADLAKYETDLVNTHTKFDAWSKQEAERITVAITRAQADLDSIRAKAMAWAEEEQLRLATVVADIEGKLQAWDKAELTNQATRLTDLEAKIGGFKPLIAELQAKLQATDEATPEKIAELAKRDADFKELTSTLNVQKLEHDKLVTNIASVRTEIEKLNKQIEHLADNSCPFCKQAFADAKVKAAELKVEVDALFAKETELSASEVIAKQQVDGLIAQREALPKYDAAEYRRLVALHESRAGIEVAITKAEGERATAQQELDYLRNNPDSKRPNPYVDQLKTAEQKLADFKPDNNPLVGQVAVAEQKLSDAQKATVDEDMNPYRTQLEYLAANEPVPPSQDTERELNRLITLQDHQKLLLKLLTDKNSFIRKAIISKTLPFLNKRIAFYTERLGLPHVVKFQPDMSCEITQHGRELDHGNLSNGEKKRLNLSLCLSFRDALSYIHSRVNVLFTDEIDGGSLDEQAVNNVISLLKHKAWDDNLSIFIISHRPEFDGRCDRTLTVRKESGFSSIIEQID